MFGFFGLQVVETPETIIVKNINGHALGKFITSFWKTSVIEKYMFKKVTGGRFGQMEFYKFFTLDVIYMLEKLSEKRNGSVPARTLHQIVELLKQNTWYKDTQKEPSQPRLDFKKLDLFNYKPLPHQQGFLEYYNKIPTQYHLNGALLSAAAGMGKQVSLDTPVRIPNGWKLIKDINVGDIVNTPNGDTAKVIGVYDNEPDDFYRITFADGRSCECGIDHQWEIFSEVYHGSTYKTLTMRELLKLYNDTRVRELNKGVPEDKIHYRLHVPLVDPTHSGDKEIELPLDPYVLGCIIGDGHVTKGGWVEITKPDEWLYSEVDRLIQPLDCYAKIKDNSKHGKCNSIILRSKITDSVNFVYRNPINLIMKQLGLNGKRSWEKFIPEMYMNASFDQRLALIQGLMDTDGCINKASIGRNGKLGNVGTIEWATTSEVLALQVLELLRSVGCIAKVTKRQTYFTHNGERKPGRISYRINVRSQIQSSMFRTPVKRDICYDNNQYAKKGLKLRIKSIEYIGKKVGRCLEVDHPDRLYIINDYICTHNTFSDLVAMTLAGVEKIIIVAPKIAIINVWEADINKHFKNPPKYWHSRMNSEPDGGEKIFIYHYESLEKAFGHFDKYIKTNNVGLVLDESHNLNDIKAQRTQNWLNLVKHTGTVNVIHASGTPLKALGSEAIPLLRAIDPMFTPKAEEAFKKIYGSDGKRGLDILRNRLGLISYTSVKSELGLAPPEMLTLPVKTPNGNNFTLTKVREAMKVFMEERYKYYKSREKEDIDFYRECLNIHASKLRGKEIDTFDYYKACVRRIQATTEYSMVKEEISFCKRYEFTEISKNLPQQMVKPFRSVCSVIKYLPLKIQGECLGNVVGKMRIQAHVEMCAHIPFFDICESTKKKTVVFTSFVDVLETAFNACKDKGLDPILVYGKTSQNIAGIVKSFGGDEKVNPLIATYDSLSTAVPLTMADTMIMINAPFRAYIQDQAISRIHRLNQDSQTRVYQCFLDTGNESNISSRSLDIMKWSQQMVEEMTGVKSPYTIEDAADGSISVSAEGFDDSLNYSISIEDIVKPKTLDINRHMVSDRYHW